MAARTLYRVETPNDVSIYLSHWVSKCRKILQPSQDIFYCHQHPFFVFFFFLLFLGYFHSLEHKLTHTHTIAFMLSYASELPSQKTHTQPSHMKATVHRRKAFRCAKDNMHIFVPWNCVKCKEICGRWHVSEKKTNIFSENSAHKNTTAEEKRP